MVSSISTTMSPTDASSSCAKICETHFVDAFFFVSDEETSPEMDDTSLSSFDEDDFSSDTTRDETTLPFNYGSDDSSTMSKNEKRSVELCKGITTISKGRRVRFASNPITDVHYRPKTNESDISSLYYDSFDYDCFRMDLRMDRNKEEREEALEKVRAVVRSSQERRNNR
eukprot:scaffold39726_cov45-Attheya_sp.AAC.3